MPPETSRTSSGKSSTTPFRPPGLARPSANTTSSDDEFGIDASLLDDDLESLASAQATSARPSIPQTAASSHRPRAAAATTTAAAPPPANDDREPCIPTPLLTRIMHESFTKTDTGLSRGAQTLMARYIDVFVREAVARAAEEQRRKGGGDEDVGGTWVDAADLEAVVPGLLMDF